MMNNNRKMTTCVFLCCIAAVAFGAKLSESVPKGWGEDFAAAKEEAKNSGKLLLLAFSGSDWCGWCVKMEKDIYSNKTFIKKAKEKYVLVMIDNPRNKGILSKMAQRQNPDLVKKYGIRGYPSTVIARPSGEVVKRFGGYQRDGVDAFLEKLDAVAAEAGVEKGDDKNNVNEETDISKDDRFFCEPNERSKISMREMKQRNANFTNEFELTTFAGIKLGSSKADGDPALSEPYHILSNVQKVSYIGGKLAGFTLAAPVKDIKAMSADELRKETCKLVRTIENDLGIRFAVTSSKIDFNGKKTSIQVYSSRLSGQLAVQVLKKK